ncbi:hypothetical protein NQ318_009761 [Aromia moschata]|uniref:Mitochondrial coenzyme A transporter SLC25A42 n=1 Tax=Aromia moschata TaxID=1265417 RepID=A0AAV8Y9I2_9CUCU|nr:hypothetical protein NQ318_009761 [Aromia moschata]
MARIVPHASIQFTAHEQWKRVLRVDQAGKTPGKLFLAGSLAGATSQSLTYPLDLARARMAVTHKHEYATLRERLFREHVDSSHTLNPIASLSFGAVAGLLGQSSSYPLDIVRRRMQTDTTGKYPNMIRTLVYVYTTEGIRGFYKGLSMNWIKGPIAVGISFATYDHIKDFLRNIVVKYRNKLLCIE